MKLIEDFIIESSPTEPQKGKTGSKKVKGKDQLTYQLKPSILDNTLKRRARVGGTDRENFGEVIAAFIAAEFVDKSLVPEVETVYDRGSKRILICSKYITGDEVRDLDGYMFDELKVPKGKSKHVKFVKGDGLDKGTIGVDGLIAEPLKQSLADAIVISAILGDHDVNPGNMLDVTKNGVSSVARIDYGHALNDLLNTSKTHGGQVRDVDNPILDFFNRAQVGGIGGSPSKLWRDYPGMIPSQEIVNSLRQNSADYGTKVTNGILKAQKEFITLLEAAEKANDQETIDHLKKSLSGIYNNITGRNLDNSKDPMTLIRATFETIGNFVKTNCQNLDVVANAMELQVAIDSYLKEGKKEDLDKIRSLALEAEFPMNGDKQVWVRTSKEEEPFVGGLQEYIKHRAKHFSKGKQNTDIADKAKNLAVAVTPPIIIADETYTYVRALSGRGQAGRAGFFTKDGSQFLIKEDDPATCLAEGLAFIPRISNLPPPTHPPIIKADTRIPDGEELQIVSQQAGFVANPGEEMLGFDVLILGRKREPSAKISDESTNESKVKATIKKMSPDVKRQLAFAVFTSQVNGDESLHTGQFMVSHKNGEISKIQRIDLGALGRYALQRVEEKGLSKHDPLTTSSKYKHSGQFGKDYVSYLVKDEGVRKELLELWKNADPEDIKKQIGENFDKQMAELDKNPIIKREALLGFYKNLARASKEGVSRGSQDLAINELESLVRAKYIATTMQRCNEYQANASLHIAREEIASFPKSNSILTKLSALFNKICNQKSKSPEERVSELKEEIGKEILNPLSPDRPALLKLRDKIFTKAKPPEQAAGIEQTAAADSREFKRRFAAVTSSSPVSSPEGPEEEKGNSLR